MANDECGMMKDKCMQKMTINDLTHDGWRRLKIVGDAVIDVDAYMRHVPLVACEHLVTNYGQDELLGLFSLEMLFPVYGPYQVMIHSLKKFRSLMFIHNVYAKRVSDCIDLARTEFFAGTRAVPAYAFVQKLPKGAEDGMEVHGCILLAAEWMPAHCVATGGCDVG
jgi:hypothetical protein